MSKLPFEISASFKSAKFNRHMVSSSIVTKSEYPFYRIVILAMAVTFLSVIAIGSAFAHDMAVFELRLEHAGNMYVLDSGMTGDDCVNATHAADSFIDQHGAKVRIAADDPLYCVSM